MAKCGIPRIDQLIAGQDVLAVGNDPQDRAAAGLVQDLLAGQGISGMPGVMEESHASFGPKTTAAVQQFQQSKGLPASGKVDAATLKALVDSPATRPTACLGYLTLVLDFEATSMLRVMSLTTLFEGAGRFAAFNANTDKAGLSFGLIQWAQKPLRLNELLRKFQSSQPQAFVNVLADGDAARAQGLIAHTAKTRGGTNTNGSTTDPGFDLVKEPWAGRFKKAALDRALQAVQVTAALDAFNASFRQFQNFAPQIKSERGVAFMLDVANQHGDGGAKGIFQTVNQAEPGLSEPNLLTAIENEAVRRVSSQFGVGSNEAKSTHNRREAFRTTPLLSDAPFSLG
ncbi:MAG: peptidoglycan-binding domain-containing protein [Acidobacteriota bacterium]